MKMTCLSIAALSFVAESMAAPEISSVDVQQQPDSTLVITYALDDGPAVVTMDVETNAHDDVWVSIGEEQVFGGLSRGEPYGDVSKVVDESQGFIYWEPAITGPGGNWGTKMIRVKLTAWPLDDKPDFMVVDLCASTASRERVRYYASTNALPGGILGNPDYRTSKMVMRKVNAKNVVWQMGSATETGYGASSANSLEEIKHTAMLTNNYYISVFPTTQAQWRMLTGKVKPNLSVGGAMRPMEGVSYNAIRCCDVDSTTAVGGHDWPAPPHSTSWLGLLRARTGIDFDLPGEGEWEFACRAGHGEGYWGTGDPITSETVDPNFPGRYLHNQGIPGNTATDSSFGPENCTPIVGSYCPNSWGIYDMCGCVRELCLDWSASDIRHLQGRVNTTPATKHIIRGGDWKSNAKQARPAWRDDANPKTGVNGYLGFRVACRNGLK